MKYGHLLEKLSKKMLAWIWWDKLHPKMNSNAEGRQTPALKDSWLEGEKSDLLGFIDFGMLAKIMIEKWEHFNNLIPSQHWLNQRMDDWRKQGILSHTIVCCFRQNFKETTKKKASQCEAFYFIIQDFSW